MESNGVQFVVDSSGNRTAVLLDLQRYEQLLEAREELECLRVFDAAKKSGETPIPLEVALHEIESP